ncbi:MAG: hypothetical protein B7Y43_15135 [Sphingomonas sp. 28-62-20]|uniref:hypothetical protein n=1 Tax=Sphingomonas sp. 28-62-20 TaxID=1970433 RepID=UPI000BC5DA04|nr:MAG: hypothetical protein B7Y43_15135 [Sphingomonas sp. 28-62-20]
MILKKVVIAVLAGGVVAPAQAETPVRPWTVALNGSAAKTDSGVTFTGGIDLSYKISDSFSVGGAATFVAASNAAAAQFSNRRGGTFLQQPQIAAGSEQWGELSGITILALSKALSLSASVGTTVNLPSRQTFGSAGLSFAF